MNEDIAATLKRLYKMNFPKFQEGKVRKAELGFNVADNVWEQVAEILVADTVRNTVFDRKYYRLALQNSLCYKKTNLAGN